MNDTNLPTYSFKIKSEGEKRFVFDEFRKKYVAVTPEEWVRQTICRYLNKEYGYPKGLMVLEAGLKVNGMQRRFDVLVYDLNKAPFLIIECKAPSVKIIQKTFEQAAAYNFEVRAQYLMVTNGSTQYLCEMDYQNNSYKFLDYIPEFPAI